jgi:hypothetical protein
MEARTYVCLFDLKAYDETVAPAMRLYAQKFDPSAVVTILEKLAKREPNGDFKHWIDSIRPDAGYKPTPQTVQELCEILIPGTCLPREAGLNPMQDAEVLLPWLGTRSEWFAELMDGGEQLAGARLEFGIGTGRLVATREQIAQFREELDGLEPPAGEWATLQPDFLNLRRILELASAQKNYTLLKTSLNASGREEHQ